MRVIPRQAETYDAFYVNNMEDVLPLIDFVRKNGGQIGLHLITGPTWPDFCVSIADITEGGIGHELFQVRRKQYVVKIHDTYRVMGEDQFEEEFQRSAY